MTAAPLRLNGKASRLAQRGHPWFFADDLQQPIATPGVLARLLDDQGRDLGLAVTGAGKLAVRRCGPWPGTAVPERDEFFRERLRGALARRPAVADGLGVRLVHGEADRLPGLVVDAYGRHLVVQVTAAAVENALDCVVPFLVEATGAESVLARNDVAVRKFEGLPQEVRLLHGRRTEEVVITEHGVRHRVRPWTGHKTGFYLDQRPARGLVQQLARGRSVLDLFCYQGGFALAALAGGATSCTAVDQSTAALELAQQGAADNGLTGLQTVHDNVFDFLRARREAAGTFDLIVLDPPAFAKSRRELQGAQRGYRDLNRQALRLLSPGGILVTCSCSHHMDLPMLEDVVRQAAAGLPFPVFLRQRLGAGDDHPVWISLPESEYLKVLVVERASD